MLYFIIGVDVWYYHHALEQFLGMLMVVLSLLLMVGSSMYARYTPTPPEHRKPVENDEDDSVDSRPTE
jgi:uncharacterized membrane protein